MKKVVLIETPETLYTETPYNREFIAALKTRFQHNLVWNKESKQWEIPNVGENRAKVKILLNKYYGSYEEIERIPTKKEETVKIENTPPIVLPNDDWRQLNNKELLDLYLAIEKELRVRKI